MVTRRQMLKPARIGRVTALDRRILVNHRAKEARDRCCDKRSDSKATAKQSTAARGCGCFLDVHGDTR
jgi:hypothetical protein